MQLNRGARGEGRVILTHEGAPAVQVSAMLQLRRSVLACMLWEKGFYESGQAVADRIEALVAELAQDKGNVVRIAALAVEARHEMHLRHVPLLLLAVLAKHASGSSLLSDVIPQVISRADELTELVAIYWRNGKIPLSAQLKKGLAKAFAKFDAYQLGKYNRDKSVKLRDVLFLTHAKPPEGQAKTYSALANRTLASPDTWEVALSAGADKRETFERLMLEGKLGYLALLRNLRGMVDAGVNNELIRQQIRTNQSGRSRVLPFRYIAAVRAAPQFANELNEALVASVATLPMLRGRTVVLVDVSGSMDDKLSAKSDLRRIDAAAGLAALINAERTQVFTFSEQLIEVPPWRGLAGIDAVIQSQTHSGTYLGQALVALRQTTQWDRLIVITDEQSHDRVDHPGGACYMVNVAANTNGVGYGKWLHVDGFSENIIRYVVEYEAESAR